MGPLFCKLLVLGVNHFGFCKVSSLAVDTKNIDQIKGGIRMLSMENVKRFVMKNFETIVAFVLVATIAFTVLVVVNKVAFLNFFYVPTLLAAYVLGKRKGITVAAFAVLLAAFYAVLNPSLFAGNVTELPAFSVVLWGSFLLITAYMVGSLYETKEKALGDLRQAYEGLLEILSKLIDSVDKYTQEHSVRVSRLATKIAEAMQLPATDIENIRVAGLLHDVGKIDISIDVLRKASALNADEWEEVKQHPMKASSVLRPVGGLLKEVIPLIATHHEYFDGKGYYGLKIGEIPLGSRILAVVDAYDAMITDRPYRKGKTAWEARLEIERLSGEQFDPEVVKAFWSVVQKETQFA